MGSSSGLSIHETRKDGDIQACFNNPPSNPEFTGTSESVVEELYGGARR